MTDQPRPSRMDDWMPKETRDHFKAAADANRKAWESLLPPGFAEQRREARKQVLLAARSWIDNALKRTTRDQ